MSGPRSNTFNWTKEAVATLKREAKAHQSASEIGKILGVSRSAVIGKANRMKIPLRGKQVIVANSAYGRQGRANPTVGSRPAPRAPKANAPTPSSIAYVKRATPEQAAQAAADYRASPDRRHAFDPAQAPAGARIVPLVDLEQGECKWPLYEDGPMVFCGCKVMTFDRNGQPHPYCDHHQTLSLPKVVT